MDSQKPLTETVDDTQIDQELVGSDDAAVPEPAIDEAGPSIELAIEALAGMDAAEAPELADEVAARLRAQLSDR